MTMQVVQAPDCWDEVSKDLKWIFVENSKPAPGAVPGFLFAEALVSKLRGCDIVFGELFVTDKDAFFCAYFPPTAMPIIMSSTPPRQIDNLRATAEKLALDGAIMPRSKQNPFE